MSSTSKPTVLRGAFLYGSDGTQAAKAIAELLLRLLMWIDCGDLQELRAIRLELEQGQGWDIQLVARLEYA